jgi:hypothetical protein
VTLRFRLSAAASVTITVSRVLAGRLRGARCTPLARVTRRPAVCRYLGRVRGAVTVKARAGTDTATLLLWLRRLALPAGTYELTAAPTTRGQRGVPARSQFVVLR